MSTTEANIKRLQREVQGLKKRVARLERRANGRKRAGARMPKMTPLRPTKRVLDDNARADEILRRAGLLSDPTEKEKQLVAEWRAVPEVERKRVLDEFYHLKLDKPLSEIIIENRR